MSISTVNVDPRAREVQVTEDELIVHLADGRRIAVPLAWYPKLLHASQAQRSAFELIGQGLGIHWPEIDEDLSVAGFLKGTPAERCFNAAF